MSVASRGASLARHLGVAGVSLLLVGSAVAYAVAPAGEALAARVATMSSRPGHEQIAGRIVENGHPVGGETVKIEKKVDGKEKVVKTIHVSANGRFRDRVDPGKYQVVISKGDKHVTEHVSVTRGHSEYIGVTVTRHGGGFGIAPVIFNY